MNLFLRYCLFACLLDNNKKISCEAEFDAQVVALKVQHAQELASLLHLGSGASDNDGRGSNAVDDEHDDECATKKTDETLTSTSRGTAPPETTTNQSNNNSNNNNKKQDKARRKRQEQRAAELERQRQIEQEIAQAGPLPRPVELEQLQQILVTASSTSSHQQQQHFEIVEIPADGHCLYRAVAAQLNRMHCQPNNKNNDSSNYTNYQTIRARCADQLQQHPDEYMHFAELHNDDNNNNHETTTTTTVAAFTEYCERVRSGSDWGGHLELRALATALQRPIHIYSVAAQGCVIVEPEEPANSTTTTITSSADAAMLQPIRLSYHVHYYALGEHYNEVVVVVDPS